MNFLRKIVAMISVFVWNNIFTVEASTISPVSVLTPQKELEQAITTKTVNVICVQRTFDPFLPIFKIQKHVKAVFDAIDEEIVDDVWNFVIFSEHFWGGATQLLTSQDVQCIVEECNALSQKHPKLIIHINFLHEFDISELTSQSVWLSHGVTMEPDASKIFGEVKPGLEAFQKTSNKHISNYSLLIYEGSPFAIYRKSTYANESDMDISGEYIYEFGDFKTHEIIQNGISGMFTGENPKIVTRICADMNNAFLVDIPNSAEIIIVPANMKRIDESIKKINAGNIIFIDTNPSREVSHLQKAPNDVHLKIYRPVPVVAQELDADSGFKLYKYRLSDVSEFPSVDTLPSWPSQQRDETGQRCCYCIIL